MQPKITIIVGPPGSGKSQKLDQILNEYNPDEATILKFGNSLEDLNPRTKLIVLDEVPNDAELMDFILKIKVPYRYVFISNAIPYDRALSICIWAHINYDIDGKVIQTGKATLEIIR